MYDISFYKNKKILNSFLKDLGVAISTARAGNVIGGEELKKHNCK